MEPSFSAPLSGARVSRPPVRLVFHLQLHPLLAPHGACARAPVLLRVETHYALQDALESAMKSGLWGHALLLASKMDSRTHARVMTR